MSSHSHEHGHEHGHGGGGDCCAEKQDDCCGGGGHGHAHGHQEVDHSHGHASKNDVHIRFWGGWGYERFATALSAFLTDEFGSKINLKAEVNKTGESGAFEVTVGGKLIHSKLTMGHGKCQSDEELDNIIDNINKIIA